MPGAKFIRWLNKKANSNQERPGKSIQDIFLRPFFCEVDFRSEADEILKTLGYKTNWKEVQKGNQEALIQLLYAFKKGMTNNLKTQMTEKGTNPALIENIIGYAAQMEEANVDQESLKQTSQELTAEAVTELNGI